MHSQLCIFFKKQYKYKLMVKPMDPEKLRLFSQNISRQCSTTDLLSSFEALQIYNCDRSNVQNFRNRLGNINAHQRNQGMKQLIHSEVCDKRTEQIDIENKEKKMKSHKERKRQREISKKGAQVLGIYLLFLNSLLKFTKIKFFRDVQLISSENYIVAGIIFTVITALFILYYIFFIRFFSIKEEETAISINESNYPHKMKHHCAFNYFNRKRAKQVFKVENITRKDLTALQLNIIFLKDTVSELALHDYLQEKMQQRVLVLSQKQRQLQENRQREFQRKKQFIQMLSLTLGFYLLSIMQILSFFKPQTNSLTGGQLHTPPADIVSGLIIGLFSTLSISIYLFKKVLPYRNDDE